MKIVVALDKFKGTLDAPTACRIVHKALLQQRPGLTVIEKPMADGGDGTAKAMIAARGGGWISERVLDPLGREIESGYGWFDGDHTAVVEMAAASGLALLKPQELDPLKTTTFGTGQLIGAAIQRGARKLWLGVGGSATVDGGVGAAVALGWKFLDAKGKPVGHGGGELERIARIGRPGDISVPEIDVLCDVDNTLCGEHGAARVFGPQKGATPEMVERLDAGLAHLAALIKEQLGKDVAEIAGAGAAGGLAAGAMAFMNARLVPGIDTIMSLSGLETELSDADWVITGEGKFDGQSLRGKVVSGVARLARKNRTKVAVLAGSVQVSREKYQLAGIEVAFGTMREGMTIDHAFNHAEELLAATARELAARFLEGRASARPN